MTLDLATITMDQDEATRRLAEYRDSIRDEWIAADAAIAQGYRELAKGRTLIRLAESINRGGADELGRPRIAVARMIDSHIWVDNGWQGEWIFSPSRRPAWNGGLNAGVVRIRRTTNVRMRSAASAIVPLVPTRFRPKRARHRHFVLFEAEWEEPPRDPALIRHLAGDLWVVLATWDLTDLERAVLA